MKSLRFCAIGAVALLASACAQPAPAPPPGPDLAAEERTIRAADAAWLKAAQARDAAGEAASVAPDGVIYRANLDPVTGPAAFEALSEKLYKENPKATSNWVTETVKVASSGDMAVQTGTYNLTGLGPKGDISDTGKFVTVWKKVNGAWKVAYDIASTTVPAPPQK
jgi:uncharacterized protein (TIGR02246 family)